MWAKEEVFQKGRKFLCTIVTNCGINSQSFHKGFHSLSFVMCNGCLVPIFTCRYSQSNKEEGWKFLFMCSKVTGCQALSFSFFLFLTETITLFIANKCWHLKGAAAGDRKKERVRGRTPVCSGDCLWCYLTTVPCPWGSPPENKVCISINQLLMKAFGLRKKPARGYTIHVSCMLLLSASEVEVNDKIFQFTPLMNQRI